LDSPNLQAMCQFLPHKLRSLHRSVNYTGYVRQTDPIGRGEFATARLLRLRVRITPGA